MSLKMRFFVLFTLTLNLVSCSTAPLLPAGIPSMSDSQYETLVTSKTKRAEVYSGFYNKVTVSATLVDHEMALGMLTQKAKVSQWDLKTYEEQKKSLLNEINQKTQFFVSFFTPERRYDNLNSSQPSWTIYLDVNGQRYVGTASKIKAFLNDLVLVYPEHNQWSTPYKVEFTIPSQQVEGKKMTFIITGTEGTVSLDF